MPVVGRCHCGATQFEVSAAPDTVTRCTCTFCHKRGALWAYYPAAQFRLTTARDRVSTYQWRSYTVHHHHCAVCGCGTYTETPGWVDGKPDFANPHVAVNAWLFEELDAAALPVTVVDGRNNW